MVFPIERCAWEGCEEKAEFLAEGRDDRSWVDIKPGHKLGRYCNTHAEIVANETMPEYTVSCPCCGCMFGVN